MVQGRPSTDEYAPYYGKYIDLVPGDDILAALQQQLDAMLALLGGLSESQGDQRYAPDKWSIKEVVGHIIDVERIFAYRALRIGRNDATPLAGFEHDDYVAVAQFGRRTVADLAVEYALVRRSNVELLRHFDDAAWMRRGTASGNPVTVRALAYMMAGHDLHHRQLLQSRYL